MSGRVFVVGSVNVDLVIAAERLPEPGETVLGGTFNRFHGGKGGNQAVAAARLGVPVTLVAALGDDTFGDEAAAALEAQGVGTDAVVRARAHGDRRRADPRRRRGARTRSPSRPAPTPASPETTSARRWAASRPGRATSCS